MKPGLVERALKHPLASLGAAVVPCVLIAVGAVQWWDGQAREVLKARADAKIEELQTQLAAIQRTAGNEEQLLDLRRTLIPQDAVRAIPTSFTHFSDQGIFVAVPKGDDWKYDLTTDRGLRDRVFPPVRNLGKLWPVFSVLLWSNTTIRNVTLTVDRHPFSSLSFTEGKLVVIPAPAPAGRQVEEWHLFPYVAVKRIRWPLDQRSPSHSLSDEPGGFMMNEFLTETEIMSMEASAGFTLVALQKKRDVVYVHARLDLPLLDKRYPGDKCFIDIERFAATSESGILVIDIWVPSTDGRSAAYGWINQWLNGLRVPLDQF